MDLISKYKEKIETQYSNNEEFRVIVDILKYFSDRHGKEFVRDAINSVELLNPEITMKIQW